MTAAFTELPRDIDKLVADCMSTWHIPGLALAIVQKDAPAITRTWGHRDIEANQAVDADTLFAICSISKSFTATGAALLVDEGKLHWDTPIRAILPEFVMKDPEATEKATLRDLLSHRTGLPRHDWVHLDGHLDSAGMLAVLRHLEPTKPFRNTYQYQNIMYLVAGLVIERVAGQSWENFTRGRIFQPLGMSEAVTSLEDMITRANFAAPHAEHEGKAARVPFIPIRTRPSGAICASISEMVAWLRFHIDPVAGHGGLRLSTDSARQLTTPHIYTWPAAFPELAGSGQYGLGFDLWTYRGERRIAHAGGWSGYNSEMRILPERGAGVVVLTNASNPACAVVANTVLDLLMGAEPPAPWFERVSGQAWTSRAHSQKEIAARDAQWSRNTQPSHALVDYAGDYAHPAYGVVRIDQSADALRFRGLGADLALIHRQYDTFEVEAAPHAWLGRLILRFQLDRESEIESFTLPLDAVAPPIVFHRKPADEMFTAEFLTPLAGRYRRFGVVYRIAIGDNNGLTFQREGGPVQSLSPRHGGRFTLDADEACRFAFRRGADGKVDGMLIHELTGIGFAERDVDVVPINFAISPRAALELQSLTKELSDSDGCDYVLSILWDELYEESQQKVIEAGLLVGWVQASEVAADTVQDLDGLRIVFTTDPAQAERFRGQIIDFDGDQFCFASSGTRLPR